jgi:hypothetical protein
LSQTWRRSMQTPSDWHMNSNSPQAVKETGRN